MSNEKIDFDIDYYRILGVDEEANENEIKSAYRRLVKENHPDRNKSPEAIDVFKNVQDAYTIFKDPSLKATYDASRAMLQTGLPHFHQERKIDWGAAQEKMSGIAWHRTCVQCDRQGPCSFELGHGLAVMWSFTARG